jgi:murein L,D-transpeptidase YafK
VKNPESSYHLSLGLSYPNIEDAERGLRENLISQTEYDSIINAIDDGVGPPQTTALGGFIYIHGEGGSKDWTRGCVALENADIEELYEAVSLGTPISIRP